MYNRCVVYPYNLGSSSAKLLSDSLDTKRLLENGTYRYRHNHLVINWGNVRLPNWGTAKAMLNMLNRPQNVALSSDKIKTFNCLQHTQIADSLPQWTSDKEVAKGWLASPIDSDVVNAVICRTLTRANSGRGIVVAKTPEEVVNAPLYTRYRPKVDEYRVHVFRDFGIIDAQQKRRRADMDPEVYNRYIRSYNNGWVFCRDDVVLPDRVKIVALVAIAALGLDFGAVDIGYSPKYGLTLYEVNTAPGLEGQTLTNYVSTFQKFLNV